MLDRATTILAVMAVCALGWVAVDQFETGEQQPAPASSPRTKSVTDKGSDISPSVTAVSISDGSGRPA